MHDHRATDRITERKLGTLTAEDPSNYITTANENFTVAFSNTDAILAFRQEYAL